MSNILTYEVYKNTVRKLDGFNPVSSEHNYTQLHFRFRFESNSDPWRLCHIITAVFFVSVADRQSETVSQVNLRQDNTVSFTIPSAFQTALQDGSGKLHVGLIGSVNINDTTVTAATNIITVNIGPGAMVADQAVMNVYEQLLATLNTGLQQISAVLDTKANTADVYSKTEADGRFLTSHQDISGKADKATTLAGYGIADAYTKAEADGRFLTSHQDISGKANVDDVYSKEQLDAVLMDASLNLLDIPDATKTSNGLTAVASGNLVTVSGTASGTGIMKFVPESIALKADTDYVFSVYTASGNFTGTVQLLLSGNADLGGGVSSYVVQPVGGASYRHFRTVAAVNVTGVQFSAADAEVVYAARVQLEEGTEPTQWHDPKLPSLKVYDKQEIGVLLGGKADKATTLAGYGITDAYTKEGTRSLLLDYAQNLIDIQQGGTASGVTVSVDSSQRVSVSGSVAAGETVNINLPIAQTEAAPGDYVYSMQQLEGDYALGSVFLCVGNGTPYGTAIIAGGASLRKFTVSDNEPAPQFTMLRMVFANRTGEALALDYSFKLQLERGTQVTEWMDPGEEAARMQIKSELLPDTENVAEHVIEVDCHFTGDEEGFGKTKFRSVLAANDSISNSSAENRYTILIADGTYNEFSARYHDQAATAIQGIRAKDYVTYCSKSGDPKKCILIWDAAQDYSDSSNLTDETAKQKCIFHVSGRVGGDVYALGLHTTVRGLTLISKNTRYGMHCESGGRGRNVDWLIENCIIRYGARPDIAGSTPKPVVGIGMSPFEHGTIRGCDIAYLSAEDFGADAPFVISDVFNGSTVTQVSGGLGGVTGFSSSGLVTTGIYALNAHDNIEPTGANAYVAETALTVGGKLTLEDNRMHGLSVGLSPKKSGGTPIYTDGTAFEATITGNLDVNAVDAEAWTVYVGDAEKADKATTLAGYGITDAQSKVTSTSKLSSDLVDDSGKTNKFITDTDKTTWNSKYSKPSGGIPKTDLASAVQTSLGKADTALQSYTEQYTGTITGITMNGASKGTSGVVNLGTVLTAHQDISGKADKSDVYLKSALSVKTLSITDGGTTANYSVLVVT